MSRNTDHLVPMDVPRAQVCRCRKCGGVILACSVPVREAMAHELAELMIDGHMVDHEPVPKKNWRWCLSSTCPRTNKPTAGFKPPTP